jgi:hypothetical protein
MKGRFAWMMLCLVVTVPAWAQDAGSAQSIHFADVPWGSTKALTKQAIVAAGFTFVSEDTDGDLKFSGPMPIIGEPTVIFAFFAPGDRLVKIQVNVATPDHRALPVYREIRQSLSEKYGPPTRDMEHYSYPYDDHGGAVGHETTAIRLGKGQVVSVWGTVSTGGVVLKVTDKLADQLDYESAQWSDELARRKKAASGW